MPNGDDGNVIRLALTCAEFRERYGDWPSHVTIDPGVLWNIAMVLGAQRFERACQRVTISTISGEWPPFIRAAGDAGQVTYSDVKGTSLEARDRAAEWLGLW